MDTLGDDLQLMNPAPNRTAAQMHDDESTALAVVPRSAQRHRIDLGPRSVPKK
jgi:hypothetical protein